jgi:hypothetical protein
MNYTPDQIKQFVTDKGIANNPYAMYTYAQQYGVGADQVDKAMGYDAGTSQKWIQQQGLSMPGQPQQPPTMPGAGGPPPSMPQQPPPNPYMPNSSPTQTPGNQQRLPGQQNPYTQQMGQDITRQVTNNLQRNILPGIGRGAVAAGGYGGSRQGIAEGLAIGETNNNLAGQLANLYGNQFNTDRNYGLQSDALDLNVYNANQNWMNQGQQNQIGLIDKMMGWNQQGINNATQVQNTPLNYYSQFANLGNQFGGLGGSNSTNMPGNQMLGGLAGAQLFAQLFGGR